MILVVANHSSCIKWLYSLRAWRLPSRSRTFQGGMCKAKTPVGKESWVTLQCDLLSGGDVPQAGFTGRCWAGHKITGVLLL